MGNSFSAGKGTLKWPSTTKVPLQCRRQGHYQVPFCSFPPTVKRQLPQLWCPRASMRRQSLALLARAWARRGAQCPVPTARCPRWPRSCRPGRGWRAALEHGQSHCPAPLCASPTRLAAAFLCCYCCHFCREQEQSTVLALKNTAYK